MKLSLKLTNKNPGPESSPLPDGTQILLLEKKLEIWGACMNVKYLRM